MRDNILEGSTGNLINICIFSLDFVEKDIPISIDPFRYLTTCFTATKYGDVALCRYADKILVIVVISGLVAVDSQFSGSTSDLYESSNFTLSWCGRSRLSHLILSTR